MSRHHHHALFCRTHARRHDMENSFSFSRYNRLCCQHESHERAPSRWHSPLSPLRRRYFRATCSTRSLHNRRGSRKRHDKPKKRPRCGHDRCASVYILSLQAADPLPQIPLALPCHPSALFCCLVMPALGYSSCSCYWTSTGNMQISATPYVFYLATDAKC